MIPCKRILMCIYKTQWIHNISFFMSQISLKLYVQSLKLYVQYKTYWSYNWTLSSSESPSDLPSIFGTSEIPTLHWIDPEKLPCPKDLGPSIGRGPEPVWRRDRILTMTPFFYGAMILRVEPKVMEVDGFDDFPFQLSDSLGSFRR